MLLTTGTTTLFDTHALEIVNLLEPDYGTTGQKKMYVDFEALRASIIWRLQKLQPEMKHSFWHRSDYGTTGRKKNAC